MGPPWGQTMPTITLILPWAIGRSLISRNINPFAAYIKYYAGTLMISSSTGAAGSRCWAPSWNIAITMILDCPLCIWQIQHSQSFFLLELTHKKGMIVTRNNFNRHVGTLICIMGAVTTHPGRTTSLLGNFVIWKKKTALKWTTT